MKRPTSHNPPPSANRPRGFTLIELLVVISIIAVLMTLAVGSGFALKRYGKQRQTDTTLAALDAMVSEYHQARSRYPRIQTTNVNDLADATVAMNDILQEMNGIAGIGDLTTSARSGMFAALDKQIREDAYNGGGTVTVTVDLDSTITASGGPANGPFYMVLDGFGWPIIYVSDPLATTPALGGQYRGRFVSAGLDMDFGTSDDVSSKGGAQ